MAQGRPLSNNNAKDEPAGEQSNAQKAEPGDAKRPAGMKRGFFPALPKDPPQPSQKVETEQAPVGSEAQPQCGGRQQRKGERSTPAISVNPAADQSKAPVREDGDSHDSPPANPSSPSNTDSDDIYANAKQQINRYRPGCSGL